MTTGYNDPMTRTLRILAGSLFTVAVVVTGCGGGDDTAEPDTNVDLSTTSSAPDVTTTSAPEATTTEPTPTTAAPSPTTTGADASGTDGCWVHLFEEEDFDETDANFRLTEPGRFSDLENLPGATDDWDDEAESIRVGPDATVGIWPDTNFEGTPIELGPGSERADLDEEPESLELTC